MTDQIKNCKPQPQVSPIDPVEIEQFMEFVEETSQSPPPNTPQTFRSSIKHAARRFYAGWRLTLRRWIHRVDNQVAIKNPKGNGRKQGRKTYR